MIRYPKQIPHKLHKYEVRALDKAADSGKSWDEAGSPLWSRMNRIKRVREAELFHAAQNHYEIRQLIGKTDKLIHDIEERRAKSANVAKKMP